MQQVNSTAGAGQTAAQVTTAINAAILAATGGATFYKGRLNQDGTDAPTIQFEWQNTLGGAIVLGYNDVGSYSVTIPGIAPFAKIYLVSQGGPIGNGGNYCAIYVEDDNLLTILTANASNAATNSLLFYNIEFYVFP